MSAELSSELKFYFEEHPEEISPIVPFDNTSEKIVHLDFTDCNSQLDRLILSNTQLFAEWINLKLEQHKCRYGVGGYNEHRTIYSRSDLFDADEEPRRLHLGVDIWGPVGTPVFSPIDGKIHSFRFNDKFGDYGATLILEHQMAGIHFHTLYGHLNLASLNVVKGTSVSQGQQIAEFGDIQENGYWPPHLHFQLIFNLQGMAGDYPGVCRYSEKEAYLNNCPNPEMIIKHTFRYCIP